MAQAYWIGKGVFGRGGSAVKFGEKIPADTPEETINSLIKSGKASKNPPIAAGPETMGKADPDVAKLKRELHAASQANATLQEKLDRSEEKVGELIGQLEASEKNVGELTEQILQGKNQGAGPGKGKK